MNVSRLAVVALALLSMVALAAPPPSADEAVLGERVRAFADAWEAGDKEKLEGLLSEEHVHINARGGLQTRADLISGAGRGPQRRVEFADLRVTLYGDMAVVTAQQRFSSPGNPSDFGPPLRVSQVWRKEAGQWRRTLFQATIVQAAAGAQQSVPGDAPASRERP